MSRNPPFPTNPNRRPKSREREYAPPATQVAPLAINRPPSRPVTPSASRTPPTQPPMPAPVPNLSSPARPVRSGLRSRVISQNSEFSAGSTALADARVSEPSGSSAFDAAFPRQPRPARAARANGRESEGFDSADLSFSQMNALNAFKQAGARRALRDEDRDNQRQAEVAKEEVRQRGMRERAAVRRATGKTNAGDIDAVLDDIKYEWEAVLDPEFNPVDLALFLLEEENQGRTMDSFQRTKYQLEKALKGTINENYRAFEAALPHHNSLLHSLGTTQGQVSAIRASLLEVKENVGNKRADLVQLWSRGQQIDEMIKILDQIEYLKTVPDILETLMSEKRLLPAAALLMSSLKIIGNENMRDIGAVADLKSYLASQETSLREILIEELQAHLYLKTFWCDSRWAPYSVDQQSLPIVPFEEDPVPRPELESEPRSPGSETQARDTRLSRFLRDLTLKPNDPPYDLTNMELDSRTSVPNLTSPSRPLSTATTSAPESDSFTYMEHVLESLAVLGRLGNGLEVVSQRLPTEIYNLIENTINEVSERVENAARMSFTPILDGGRPSSVYTFAGSWNGRLSLVGTTARGLRLTALEMSVKENHREVLSDLFWTLFSKLDAVIQGMRVVAEVANRIGSRKSFKDSSDIKPGSFFSLEEQWRPIQAEVQSLLHDYLIDEQGGSAASRNPIASINEVMRLSKDRGGLPGRPFEASKVFRFADSDAKSASKALKAYEDELTRALHDTVPGLANAGGETSIQAAFSSLGSDDLLTSAGSHRTLLSPDAFHIGVLFRPTIVFLDHVVDNLPPGTVSAHVTNSFIDEFALNVYLPRLEEKVAELFHSAISGPEAFREDVAYRALSSQPLVKASVQIVALVNTLCSMLHSTPFHKDSHSRLVLGIVVQFYQRCSDQYRDLVARETFDGSTPPVILAAQWAQNDDIASCLSQQRSGSGTSDALAEETRLEISLSASSPVREDDVLSSIRDLGAMCQLHNSLTWFVRELQPLRHNPDSVTPSLPDPQSARTPNTPHLPRPSLNSPTKLYLPLSQELATRFSTVLQTFQQLADVVLFTVRLEIRCRAVRQLYQMAKRSNYQLERDATEPDLYVVELNAELAKCDELCSTSLSESERKFIFDGLATLISDLIVQSAIHIRMVNDKGLQKMLRNILALQQNMKIIMKSSLDDSLEVAKKYWSSFCQSPKQFISSVRSKKLFSFDEYEAMLNFIYGIDKGSDPKSSSRDYNAILIELHELTGQEL